MSIRIAEDCISCNASACDNYLRIGILKADTGLAGQLGNASSQLTSPGGLCFDLLWQQTAGQHLRKAWQQPTHQQCELGRQEIA
jgi:hypothetical protein